MSLAQRGSATTGSQGSGSGFTVAAPAGLAAGDTILICSVALSGTIGALSGFADSGESVASAFHCRAWSRVADGTEGPSFGITSAGTPGAAICVAFSGSGGTDPAAPSAAFVSASSSASVPVPGVTLSYGGDWLVWFGAAMRNSNTTPGTVTAPAGYTPLGNTGPVVSGSESLYLMAAALETSQSPGTTGAQTGTASLSVPRAGWLTGVTLAGARPVTQPGMFMVAFP